MLEREAACTQANQFSTLSFEKLINIHIRKLLKFATARIKMNYSLKAYLSHDKWPLMKYSMKGNRLRLRALSFQWFKLRHGFMRMKKSFHSF
jgi:hypothetical protein